MIPLFLRRQTRLKATIALLTLSLLSPSHIVTAQEASALAQSSSDDLQRLQGTWHGVEAGREDAGKCQMTIKGDSIRFEGANKKEWYAGTMTLAPSKNPKQLAAKITDCPHPDFVGKVAIGIYKLEGGTLTLTGHEPGVTEAPKEFGGDTQSRTFVLKKSEQAPGEPEKKTSDVQMKVNPRLKDAAGAPRSIEQRFEEIDLTLALAHYEKLQSAAAEIRLKLQVEQPSGKNFDELSMKADMLRAQAQQLREETIKRAATRGQ